MKNSIIKMPFTLLLLMVINVKGQILKQGSIVATHRNGYYLTPGNNSIVLEILDANNTSGIPPTTTSSMFSATVPNKYIWTTGLGRPNWVTGLGSNIWDYSTLGAVFGITLDYIGNGNIYVANSSIYSGESVTKHDAIYKIDGTTGLVTPIINLSGSNPSRGIGNLKYFTNTGVNYIVFSWWEDGKIYIYKETTLGTWVLHDSFVPKFGNSTTNLNIIPYAVAVRNTSAGLSIFYGELNLSISAPNSTRVYSIPLTAAVNFLTTEILEITVPVDNLPTPRGDKSPVSDISFSKDGKKLVLAQQTLISTGSIGAHRSHVYEYYSSGATWVQTGRFPSGYNSPVSHPGYPAASAASSNYYNSCNAAGGVTYFDNILFTDGKQPNNLSCDTSVLFTSDWIYFGLNVSTGTVFGPLQPTELTSNFAGSPPYLYGIQGMPSKNTFANDVDAFSFSLKVNELPKYDEGDKTNLGDIEAYNPPLNCSPVQSCNCGLWNNIMMGNSTWWTGGTAPVPALTFNQGQSTGVLFPNYACQGNNCGSAEYQYELLNATYTVLQSGMANTGIDLSNTNIKNLPCGNYTIRLIPKCGNNPCSAKSIPLVITCPPPGICDCKGTVTINASQQSLVVTPQNNIAAPNPVSTVTGSFNLTASLPVTEVRMLIDEFRVTTATGNENCQLCKNKPQTWASINAATLSGITSQTAITATINNDVREFVFNNGANTSFNLTGNTLNFTLGVPGVTGLNCCKLKGEVCIKFIIRDVNCCEREVLKCFTFELQ